MSDSKQNFPSYKSGIWIGPQDIFPIDYYQLGKELIENLQEFPNFISQIDGVTREERTYGAIADRTIRCALWLRKQGVLPGDIIGFCSKNHLDTCIPLFASLCIGSIFNAWLNDGLNEDSVKYFMESTKPKVMFVDEESLEIISRYIPDIDERVRLIIFGKIKAFESFENIMDLQKPEEIKKFQCTKIENADVPAIIMYTSGTTGRPKGVVHTFGSIRAMIRFDVDDGSRKVGMWFSTLCGATGVIGTIKSGFIRSTIINHNCLNEEEACKMIETYKVTWLMMRSDVANRLYKTKAVSNYDLSSINYVTFGGAIMRKEVEEFMIKLFSSATLVPGYGSTETGMATAGILIPQKWSAVGLACPNIYLKVVDPEMKETLGPNQEGELYIKGKTLMAGYWKSTKAIDLEGWYHTGDLGYHDEDGYFYIVGRLKEVIKYKMHHVAQASRNEVPL